MQIPFIPGKIVIIFILFFAGAGSAEEAESRDLRHTQVFCAPATCQQIEITDGVSEKELKEIDGQIRGLMGKNSSEILIRFPSDPWDKNHFTLKDGRLEKIRLYFKGIAASGGIVHVEPYYIRERNLLDKLPVISDLYSVGGRIITALRESSHNKYTEYYHARVIYDIGTGRILFVNFIHRGFDSPCNTILTDCSVISYINDDSFDHTLSAKLRGAGTPLEVRFDEVAEVTLPEKELTLENMENLKSSARILKWILVAGETTMQDVDRRERFVDPASLLSGLSYAITLYDAVKAVILYRPAADARAQVYYRTGREGERKVEKIVFVPGKTGKEK